MSPICEKCEQSEADLLHGYMLCPKLQNVWVAIFSLFSKAFKVQLQPDPVLVILGTSEQCNTLQNAQLHLLSYGLLCAKKHILLLWKSKDVPSFKAWITALTDTLHLERIRYILKDRVGEFDVGSNGFIYKGDGRLKCIAQTIVFF